LSRGVTFFAKLADCSGFSSSRASLPNGALARSQDCVLSADETAAHYDRGMKHIRKTKDRDKEKEK
jgi:hypothetical protein